MTTMGWKAGQGLGRQGTGIQEPIKAFNQVARRGFGSGPNQTPTERKTKTEDRKVGVVFTDVAFEINSDYTTEKLFPKFEET